MILDTSYLEADGISPTKKLVDNWNCQLRKLAVAVNRRTQACSTVFNSSGHTDVNSPSSDQRSGRIHGGGLLDLGMDVISYGSSRATGTDANRKRPAHGSLPSFPETKLHCLSEKNSVTDSSYVQRAPLSGNCEQLAKALCMLAGSMQASSRPHTYVSPLADQHKSVSSNLNNKKTQETSRKQSEDKRLRIIQQKIKEDRSQRLNADLLRMNEQQRRIVEGEDLRQIQLQAKRTLEAEITVNMAKNMHSKKRVEPPNIVEKSTERIKNKIARAEPHIDHNITNDPGWKQPVVLFSFFNRHDQRKPLRGIASRIQRSRQSLSDSRSRGHQIYRSEDEPSPSARFLRLRVQRPGYLMEYEAKVASYNNRLMDLIMESNQLVEQGTKLGCLVDFDVASPSNKANGSPNRPDAEYTESQDAFTKSSMESNGSQIKTVLHDKSHYTIDILGKSHKANGVIGKSSKPRWDYSDESDDDVIWDEVGSATNQCTEKDDRSVLSMRQSVAVKQEANDTVESHAQIHSSSSLPSCAHSDNIDSQSLLEFDVGSPEGALPSPANCRSNEHSENFVVIDEIS